MSEWRNVTLAEISDRVDYGYTASASDDPALPRFLRITDIAQTHLDWSGVPGCPIDGKNLSKYELATDDIVVARTGATVGYAKRIRTHPEAVFASYLVRFRLAPEAAPSFVGAVVESSDYKRWVQQNAGGAAQPNASAKVLGAFPLRLPGKETQVKIGAIFDTIADLIENNRRRVEVLEEMVRAIYREWFVKFHYPGHQDVPLVDSAHGPVPDGWTPSTCGVELNFIGGGTPAKGESSYWEGGTVPWYTPTDLTKTGWRYAAGSALGITDLGVAKSSARRFPAGSVMMTSRATLGVLAIATAEATTNQGFIVILPDERWSPGFIYEWLDARASDLAALGTGATFKEITKGSFKSFPFVVPAQAVLDAYRVTTDPIEQQVRALEQQTRNLSVLRDLLLPKLVTGKIDVSSLDLGALVERQVA